MTMMTSTAVGRNQSAAELIQQRIIQLIIQLLMIVLVDRAMLPHVAVQKGDEGLVMTHPHEAVTTLIQPPDLNSDTTDTNVRESIERWTPPTFLRIEAMQQQVVVIRCDWKPPIVRDCVFSDAMMIGLE